MADGNRCGYKRKKLINLKLQCHKLVHHCQVFIRVPWSQVGGSKSLNIFNNKYLDQGWKKLVPWVCITVNDKASWSANNIAAMRSADFWIFQKQPDNKRTSKKSRCGMSRSYFQDWLIVFKKYGNIEWEYGKWVDFAKGWRQQRKSLLPTRLPLFLLQGCQF